MSADLLRALTHELRNSLAPIVNAAHMVRLRAGSDANLSEIVSIIERQVATMTRALEAVGEADRFARGEVALQRRRVDLAEVIQPAIDGRRKAIESRQQRLRIVSGPRPVWVDADPSRLAQAIGQLIDNAARYSDEGGEITIEVAVNRDEAEVSIEDHGRGISAEALPHVFEAFSERQGHRMGLGLGLSIARAILLLHGGTIRAQSDGEGRGSRFSIVLPVASPVEERASSASPAQKKSDASAAGAQGSRRILVADDNQAVRNSFAAILTEMGHDVRLASDGEQTLQVAEAWSPEFVILDVHMPKIDGYAIARKLRARFPSEVMQLVMMSGTDLDQTTLSGARAAGFDHCVDKTLAVKGLDALLRGEAPGIPA